ncbi:MAG: DNA ligase D [Gemmataceae bacterium]
MSLAKYKQKRQFDRTPEPRGQRKRARGPLRFVVQKHAASHLHYDFRLELDGALKSWAVPKGPSLNPADKRLAMMVEDHPLDYRTFEGIIPEGNYGAGSVIIWDEGTYCSRQSPDRIESERLLRDGLHRGHLSFVLNGTRLKGEFSLVKLQRGQPNAWLLVKKGDEFATIDVVTEDGRSVVSGRDLSEVAAGTPAKVRRSRKSAGRSKAKAKLPAATAPLKPRHVVKPMLATLVEAPFDRAGWLFEVKWDGYRAIAEVRRGAVALYSRNQLSFERRFAPIVESLRKLGHDAVLDGEVVAVDEKGRSRFQLLQNYQKTGQGALRYIVFDLLSLDGRDLRREPLTSRKERLRKLVNKLPNVLLSEHVEEEGIAFFQAAVAQGLEGIMAKDGASPYREGARGGEWLKIKTRQRQEAVIGGFTEPRGSRQDLGALVLGVYDGDELVYIGHTGGGFNTGSLADVRARLQPLMRRSCPFAKKPKTNAPVHWVEPELVCEVLFQEWTEDGRMRQPIFVGLREDKSARDVRREEPHGVRPAAGPKPRRSSQRTKTASGEKGEPTLTNLGKVYWPKEGYTKGDLIEYYRAAAPVILPYLRDRPLSLHRHPNGIDGPSFFQKDVSERPPPTWVETATLRSETRGEITYVLCQDARSLLYVANLGCIELNPWNARAGSPDEPDYLVIDLDPEDISFTHVVEAAVVVRKTLEGAGAECYCKTSGKRGLHVFVPLGARYSHDQARQFAEIVATLVHAKLPRTTSVVRSPAQRQGRVYLDFLQNRRGQTLAAPYSVRPYAGATVSAPLKWMEVRKGLDPGKFTIRTMARRLDQVGDLWEPVLGEGIDLPACLERLAGGATPQAKPGRRRSG